MKDSLKTKLKMLHVKMFKLKQMLIYIKITGNCYHCGK